MSEIIIHSPTSNIHITLSRTAEQMPAIKTVEQMSAIKTVDQTLAIKATETKTSEQILPNKSLGPLSSYLSSSDSSFYPHNIKSMTHSFSSSMASAPITFLMMTPVSLSQQSCLCYCSELCGPRDKTAVDTPYFHPGYGHCFCAKRDEVNYVPHGCNLASRQQPYRGLNVSAPGCCGRR